MNIFEKMLEITNEIGKVNKNLTVGEGKSQYKAVGEADVLKAVKELEYKNKIYSYPYARKIVDREILSTEKEYKGTITKGTKQFLRIETIYRFVNIEAPEEYIDITTYGDGLDSSDKAPGKAMTYSDKYALLKAYKMITGDDPDQNPSEENGWKNNKNNDMSAKITETEAKSIYALMIRKGYNVIEALEQAYGIKNTSDLTKKQYMDILEVCNQRPDVQTK